MLKSFVIGIIAAVVMAMSTTAMAGDKAHRLVLQISDDSQQKMATVLNVAANVSRHYSAKGEEVEIEIVAFNKGLHMLRADTSPKPVAKRIKSFSQSMTNVTFLACGQTMKGMAKKEGKMPTLLSSATEIPAGVVQIMERSEQGWTIVRP
jgi:intracellular sulfur oxidation DsrE/DsrF family protein